MKKILVPVDFSRPSVAAFDVAYLHAKKIRAKIILLHVFENSSTQSFKVSGDTQLHEADIDKIYDYRLLRASEKRLEKLVVSPDYVSVNIEGRICFGNPFDKIKKSIDEDKIDLVIMGVKGISKLERMLLGSNTEKIVRYSKVPVMAIHRKPIRYQFNHIVYATTMNKAERPFINFLTTFQKIYKSKIHVVHVNTPRNFRSNTDIQLSMEKFAKQLKMKNFTLNVHNDFDRQDGIIRFADDIGASIIAMATHGRKGFAHVLSGSVTEEIVTSSKRPTITYMLHE